MSYHKRQYLAQDGTSATPLHQTYLRARARAYEYRIACAILCHLCR